MKVFSAFSALVIVSIITSCGGIFPSAGVHAPRSIAGYDMDASGLKGSYHYNFSKDHTYRRVQIYPSGEKSPVEKGTWEWEKTSTDHAILTLDQSLEVKLHFTTHDHANATIPDSARLFPVEFSEPGEN